MKNKLISIQSLWSGYYNPSANFLDPGTYSDGTPVFTSDLITDLPAFWNGYERTNFTNNFPAAFCPVAKYSNANSYSTSSTSYRDQTIGQKYPVVCLCELKAIFEKKIIQYRYLHLKFFQR